jgi:glycosyltransferase involved in cell wall biosynthesis
MRIAVDARELVGKATGVGRYLSELLARWSVDAEATRHEWRLYLPQSRPLPNAFASAGEILPGGGGTRWEQWTLPRALRRSRPDVLFAPGYSAPFASPCPTVVTIHDVSFFAQPAWFAPREGLRRRHVTAWSARRAALVLTDTAFSRDEIVRHIGIPRGRIRVILPGLSAPPKGPTVDRKPQILFVGSIFRRRHVDRLITAFAESIARRVPDSQLTIVGEDRTYPPIDFDALLAGVPPDVRQRVTLTSFIDEQELARLYGSAAVFVFPSEYEGFGFTPLEALASHIPPIVLDTPVAREVYGPAARYISPDLSRHAELADAVVELLTNGAARDAVLQHADEVLRRYDWNRAAAATLRAIEEAAGV